MSGKLQVAALPFTPDLQANALLGSNGTAFLIAMCLEQQVRSEKAMIGPFVMRQRLGHLNAEKIAAKSPANLDAIFRRPPALHRFPSMMAKRVQALCAIIAREYDNDGAKLWSGVRSASELHARLKMLPGFGEAKAACAVRILGKYGKLKLRGWQHYALDADLPWEFKAGQKQN